MAREQTRAADLDVGAYASLHQTAGHLEHTGPPRLLLPATPWGDLELAQPRFPRDCGQRALPQARVPDTGNPLGGNRLLVYGRGRGD